MKNSYSSNKLILIVVLGFVFFLITGIIYNKNKIRDTWLICETDHNYNEKIKFKFVSDKLDSYYREEYFNFESKSDLEKIEAQFKEQRKKLVLSNDFKYDIEKDNFKLTVKTYIYVKNRKSFFDNYGKQLNVSSDDNVEVVKEVLESKEYKCSLRKV